MSKVARINVFRDRQFIKEKNDKIKCSYIVLTIGCIRKPLNLKVMVLIIGLILTD